MYKNYIFNISHATSFLKASTKRRKSSFYCFSKETYTHINKHHIMKTPTKYTPYLLSISLLVVFIAMVILTKTQGTKAYSTVSYETGTRVNQPGPKQRAIEEKVEEGNPVFLKEDVKDEIAPGAARLATNSSTNGNTAIVAATTKKEVNTNINAEEALLNKQTKIESKKIKGTDRFLVLVGEYTDNLMLLSKQGQFNVRGFDAELIRFSKEDKKYICLGRFAQERQAAAFAKTVGAQLGAEMILFDKK